MADKKRSISREFRGLKNSVTAQFESRSPCKYAVKPIDWSDLGLTEKKVHVMLYEDEGNDFNQRQMTAHRENNEEAQWKRCFGRIDWSDIGMTEEEVMELIYNDDDVCGGKNGFSKEDLPTGKSSDCDIRNFTFGHEALMCSIIDNNEEKQGPKSPVHDSESSDGKIFDEDAPNRCQLQATMTISLDIPQVSSETLKNEGQTKRGKVVCHSRKKNSKGVRKSRAIYPTKLIKVSRGRTGCRYSKSSQVDIVSKNKDDCDVCKVDLQKEKTLSKGIEPTDATFTTKSYFSDSNDTIAEEIDSSTNHDYKSNADNGGKATDMDSLLISTVKQPKGTKGIISNRLKRKFQETVNQGNCLDGGSPRKTRRLEKIEESTISDSNHLKNPKRKCIFLRLGARDLNQATKLGSPKTKRRQWRF